MLLVRSSCTECVWDLALLHMGAMGTFYIITCFHGKEGGGNCETAVSPSKWGIEIVEFYFLLSEIHFSCKENGKTESNFHLKKGFVLFSSSSRT